MSVVSWFKENRHAWNESRAKAVPVSAAAPGTFAKIEGRIVLDAEPVVSLFTGARHAIWQAIVERRVTVLSSGMATRGMDVENWEKACDAVTASAFHLVDDAGTRLDVVLGENPILRLRRYIINGDNQNLNNEDPTLARFLRTNGVQPSAFMGVTGDYIFIEGCAVEGDRVALYGKIEEHVAVEADGYRDHAVTTKRITGTPVERVIVSTT